MENPPQSQMAEYLANHFELQSAEATVRDAQLRVSDLQAAQRRLTPLIEASVSPRCGSASNPDIRTHTDGRYRTITVVWNDHLQRGRIHITANER